MLKNVLLLPEKINEKEREILKSILEYLEKESLLPLPLPPTTIGEYIYHFSDQCEFTGPFSNCIEYIKVIINKKGSDNAIASFNFDKEFFNNEIRTYLLENYINHTNSKKKKDILESRYKAFINILNEYPSKFRDDPNYDIFKLNNELRNLLFKLRLDVHFHIAIVKYARNITIELHPISEEGNKLIDKHEKIKEN